MVDLRQENLLVLEEYRLLKHSKDLSYPLLVSCNEAYRQKILSSPKRVLYLGQETHGWLNNDGEEVPLEVECLEEAQRQFLEAGATKRSFWNFLCLVQNISKREIVNSTVWSNAMIIGKRGKIGAPSYEYWEPIQKISSNYLKKVDDYFAITDRVIVSGPKEPYYQVIQSFLEEKQSVLQGRWPTLKEPLLIDEEQHIYWTYHPSYLLRKKLYHSCGKEIQKRL